jgi:zinc protease
MSRPLRLGLPALALFLLAGCAGAVSPATAPASTAPPPAAAPEPPDPPPSARITPDEPFRATRPPPLASEPPFSAPVPAVRTLKNGARLLVVENHALPLVTVEVVLERGIDDEPLDRGGLSRMVARMLTEGTTTRSAADLAIARDRIAARLWAFSDYESSTVHLSALRETLPEAVALLADVLENPGFKQADLERVRGILVTAATARKGDASAVARDHLARLLWGEKSPRGLPLGGTTESLEAITTKDVQAFYRSVYVANDAVVSVAGDITPDEAESLLEEELGAWRRGAVPPRRKLAPAATVPRSVVFTDLPGASQSQVWTGARGPSATDPDLLPLTAASFVLAGNMVTARLNASLRTQKGISYWVASSVDPYREASSFTVHAGVASAHTAEGVSEYAKELARLDVITDEELDRAKGAIVRGLPSLLETNDSVASAMATLAVEGAPLDYYATLGDRVRAMQKGDVVAAVRRVHPGAWPMVVVGAKSESFEALRGLDLGAVREVAP